MEKRLLFWKLIPSAVVRPVAQVTSQHGTIYHTLEHKLGKEISAQYAEANQRAVFTYRQLIEKKQIQCNWEDVCACLYATENESLLHTELQAQQNAGLPVKFIKTSELPFPTKGTIQLPNQGQFHPLRFLYHLADDLQIYENTRVLTADKNQLETTGGTVQAEQIIFACHFPFINWPGGYFLRMHQERSYVLALTGTPRLSNHYYAVDHGGLSLRQAGNILLLGGGSHRTGENQSGGQYDTLRRCAELLFPNAKACTCWSAQDCMTLDHIPYIGQFSAATPQWYVATGFGKWGMSNSMVAAELLRDLILGHSTAWGSIFSPQRFPLKASTPSLLKESFHAAQGLGQRFFAPAKAAAQTLPPEHGGVVEWQGEKVGIYKSACGEIWMVDIRCPHLGCQLTWNSDEKSWDCPCHGSRFDYQGNNLDHPAQEQLPSQRIDTL